MNLFINEDLLKKYNLTINEFLLLIFLAREGNVQQCIDSLFAKDMLETGISHPDLIVVDQHIRDIIDTILVESDTKVSNKEEFFTSVANKLRELYPKGNKPCTNYSWRGSTAEIVKKLKNLVAKYNCKFTEEEAINATKAYIESFNGDYRYMKLLKYFLLKTPINNNGDIEVQSEFMSYLENKDCMNRNNDNWTVDLA